MRPIVLRTRRRQRSGSRANAGAVQLHEAFDRIGHGRLCLCLTEDAPPRPPAPDIVSLEPEVSGLSTSHPAAPRDGILMVSVWNWRAAGCIGSNSNPATHHCRQTDRVNARGWPCNTDTRRKEKKRKQHMQFEKPVLGRSSSRHQGTSKETKKVVEGTALGWLVPAGSTADKDEAEKVSPGPFYWLPAKKR